MRPCSPTPGRQLPPRVPVLVSGAEPAILGLLDRSPHHALMAIQLAMNGHWSEFSGGSQFDGSLSLLAWLDDAVTATNVRGSLRSLP